MRIHILGICGTFMSGIALLAKSSGFSVVGSDANIYPPMSTLLQDAGISIFEGYEPHHIDKTVDCVIVGNVIKRGNKAMEYVLNERIPYLSGPEWLFKTIIKDRKVLAVSGTHGKTTTTSLLCWILEYAGKNPGFLVGGVPENFGVSARVGNEPFFVIEADEYDSAFFDKRAKFMHYRPHVLVLNNLEYDHADIYPDLEAIKQQFKYLLRTVPANGRIIANGEDAHVQDVLSRDCFTPVTTFGGETCDFHALLREADGSAFTVLKGREAVGEAHWSLLGRHNVSNALAAIAAANDVGVPYETALSALAQFKNVKRRLEIKSRINNITIYDDFAHHPTAIATTLQGLRANIGDAARLFAVLEFGSYTMRTGVHKDKMKDALSLADVVICKRPVDDWGVEAMLAQFKSLAISYDNVDSIVSYLLPMLRAGDHVLVMSNSGFENIHQKLKAGLEKG